MEFPKALMESWVAIAGTAMFLFIFDNVGGSVAGIVGQNIIFGYLFAAVKSVGGMLAYDKLTHIKYT